MRPRVRPRWLLSAVLAALAACGPVAAAPPEAPPSRAANQAPAAPVAPAAQPPPASARGRPTKPFQVLPMAPPAALGPADWTYFRETGHYVSGPFKAYFETNGGLGSLGYPITERLDEDGLTVQYFQRARLQLRADGGVERSLLGDLLVQVEALRSAPESAPLFAPLDGQPAVGRFYAETGQAIASPVLEFFDANGGVAAFGFPTSRAGNGVQWFQRARLEWLSGAVQAALIGDEYTEQAGLGAAKERAQPPQLGRVDLDRVEDDLDVHAALESKDLVTRLPQDAVVRVTGERRGADGSAWYVLRLWNALDGYVPATALAFSPAPLKAPGADGVPWKPPQPPAQGPFALAAAGSVADATAFAAAVNGPAAGQLASGAPVQVSQWGTDGNGRAWYRFQSGDLAGWVLAQSIHLDAAKRLPATPSGVAQVVAGKGMWFTYDTLRQTSAERMVATAKANGLTFLAPEVGTSRRGVWVRGELDQLIPAAHAAGLKVIPWMYPWLADLPGDLELAVQAAQLSAPSGDTVDGLGVDIEETLDEPVVRVYGELLRARLGEDRPLIAIVYQPQIASGRRTPYATLASTFDVLAPMAYWHVRNVSYGGQDAYDYVAESVRLIRQRVGRDDVPVTVLGQTFDWFTRNEIGPGNPTADEVRGAMQAARDSGALGVGFFNWFSTTPEEWETLAAFPWSAGR